MQVSAVVGSSTVALSDGTIGYLVGWDGLGHLPLRRLLDSGPQQHGATDRGFKGQERTFALAFDVPGSTPANLESRRNALLNTLRPSAAVAQALLFTLDSGALRQIDCNFDGATLRFATQDRHGYLQRVAAGFIAATPTFYDPAESETEWTLVVINELTFPIEFPIVFGGGLISETIAVTYTGSWDAYPLIEITGPLNGTKVQNLTTAETLDFSAYPIAAGEVVTIDCRYAAKSARNNYGANLVRYLSQASDSDLDTFHIAAADPPLNPPSKINELYVEGSGAVLDQTRVVLRYNTRYVGI